MSELRQKETEVVARSLGIQLQFHELKAPDDLNLLFEAVTKARPGALIVTGGPFGGADRKRIVEFAVEEPAPCDLLQARICGEPVGS